MQELLIMGGIKIIDNILNTAKSLTIYKNKKIIASILTIVCQYMGYVLIKSVVADSTSTAMIVICVCSGIGTFIALHISDVSSKDATFTNLLTCSSGESVEELCTYLLINDIKYIQVDSYSRTGNQNKTIIAFAINRHQSTLIDKFVKETDAKFLRQVIG